MIILSLGRKSQEKNANSSFSGVFLGVDFRWPADSQSSSMFNRSVNDKMLYSGPAKHRPQFKLLGEFCKSYVLESVSPIRLFFLNILFIMRNL